MAPLLQARRRPHGHPRFQASAAPRYPRRSAGVLLVGDPLARIGLRALLASAHGLEPAGEASSAADAAQAAAQSAPAVAVVEAGRDLAAGLACVGRIRAAAPGCAVLVLLERDDAPAALAALRAGARGVALCGAGEGDLLRAVRAVSHGEAIIGAGIAETLLASFLAPDGPSLLPFPELSDREREILELLAAGEPTGQIARRLYLSPKTIRNNVSVICTKLAVTDRVQAILLAREAGLGLG